MSKKIGLLDDRVDTSHTAQTHIEGGLASDWDFVRIPLLPTPEKVVKWIVDNDVNVLVADQNLNEEKQQIPITYKGHDVVKVIRKTLPDFPVYMLTAFGNSPDVKANKGKMEEVLERTQFYKESGVYVERMMRAGESFHKRCQDNLVRLSDLSKKKAVATLSKEEKSELKALQAQMNLIDTRELKDDLLSKFDEELKKLEGLQAKAQLLLKKHSKASK